MFDLQSVSSACVKCGKCIPHCTIYMVNRDEATSPRGFLDLLGAYKRGDLALDSTSRNIFESCFLCTTCVTHCPSSLPVDVAIESVRVDIAQKYGIAWYKRAYFFLLRHRKIADIVFSFVHFIIPCAFKQENGRLISRLKLFKNADSKQARRSIFPVWRKSFLQTYQGDITPHNPTPPQNTLTHKRVAIFIGCLSNYNYVNVGKSLLIDSLEAFLEILLVLVARDDDTCEHRRRPQRLTMIEWRDPTSALAPSPTSRTAS